MAMSTSVRATQAARKAIARRVSKGHDVQRSTELLTELTDTLSGDNLTAALVYQGFATARAADAVAAALLNVEPATGAQAGRPRGTPTLPRRGRTTPLRRFRRSAPTWARATLTASCPGCGRTLT
jgi:hypothetical protein